MLTLRKPDIWIPTALEMENCKKTIAGMVMKKFPWVKPQDAHGDLCQIAFNEGYEVYMRKAPEMQIKHPDMWVVEAGYKRGLTYAVKVLDRGKREIDMPHTAPIDDDGRQEQSMETALASEIGEIEKSNPASKALRKERAGAMLEAIRALTPKQRKAFLDVHVGGAKLEEAAKTQGVSLRVFERCLDTATAKLAWRVTLTSSEAMCDSYQDMVLSLKTPMEPSKDEHKVLRQHVIGCQACRAAVYDAPMVIDVGALLATGAFTASAGPSLGDRLLSSPVIEGPMDLGRAIVNRVTPGGGGSGHAAEAAAGATGAGATGAGGTALLLGGGKAALALCAGAATATVCVVGAATGVIPITVAKSDKTDGSKSNVPIERSVSTSATTAASPTELAQEAKAEAKAQKKQAAKKKQAQKQRAEAREAARAEKAAKESSSSSPQQTTYTSPTTTAEPTSQAATNQSSADTSMGIPTAPAAPPPAPSPTPSAQTKTNTDTANASMGCC